MASTGSWHHQIQADHLRRSGIFHHLSRPKVIQEIQGADVHHQVGGHRNQLWDLTGEDPLNVFGAFHQSLVELVGAWHTVGLREGPTSVRQTSGFHGIQLSMKRPTN